MKTAIVYYSQHHGNTKKLLDAIAECGDVTLFDITKGMPDSLEEYDIIGFASGIYFQKFKDTVLKCAKEKLPKGKKVFLIYTYGAKRDGQTKGMKAIIEEKECTFLGEYGSFGFDTFGPFKLIGGIAKGRPNEEDIAGAVEFYNMG